MAFGPQPNYNEQKLLDEQVAARLHVLDEEARRQRDHEKEQGIRLHAILVGRCTRGKPIPSGLEARHDAHSGVLTFKARRGHEDHTHQYWFEQLAILEKQEQERADNLSEASKLARAAGMDTVADELHREIGPLVDAISEVMKHVKPKERAYHAPFEPREDRNNALVGWDGVRD
jgi:hypothetical protein